MTKPPLIRPRLQAITKYAMPELRVEATGQLIGVLEPATHPVALRLAASWNAFTSVPTSYIGAPGDYPLMLHAALEHALDHLEGILDVKRTATQSMEREAAAREFLRECGR